MPERVLGLTMNSKGDLLYLVKWKNFAGADLIDQLTCRSMSTMPELIIDFYQRKAKKLLLEKRNASHTVVDDEENKSNTYLSGEEDEFSQDHHSFCHQRQQQQQQLEQQNQHQHDELEGEEEEQHEVQPVNDESEEEQKGNSTGGVSSHCNNSFFLEETAKYINKTTEEDGQANHSHDMLDGPLNEASNDESTRQEET